MKLIFSVCCLLHFYVVSAKTPNAKEIKYAVKEIPAELLTNSSAVIRDEYELFEVHDIKNATYTYRRAVTLINKKADPMASLQVHYNSKIAVASISGSLYDKHGQLVRKLKSNEIKDYSSFDGFSILDDNRVKQTSFSYPDYPFTVEFEYVLKQKNILRYPRWVPIPGQNIASQSSKFEIITPENLEIKYKELNIDKSVEIEKQGDKLKYLWKSENLKSLESEPMAPYVSEIIPLVIISPVTFMTDKYEGSMLTWESYGKWVNALNEGRNDLPAATAQKMRDLTADATDPIEKVKRIYEYLQKNTRYISVSLGIGGWQPFEASYVDQKGYGDCKALSNYMKSLLESVDIPSNYALIRAGKNTPEIISDFPAHQFNHAILCVPFANDTLWLECTDQKQPFGFVGGFIDNRYALLIGENGGTLVRTPGWQSFDNMQTTKAKVALDKDGNATAKVHMQTTGLQFERVERLYQLNKEDQQKNLYNFLDIPNFELASFNIHAETGLDVKGLEEYELVLRRYGASSGKRVFFQPNLLNKNSNISRSSSERLYPLVQRFPYLDIDSVHFELPHDCHIEYVPETTFLESDFGRYEASFSIAQGSLLYIRKFEKFAGKHSKDAYVDYVEFMNKIMELDNVKLVMLKST